MKALLDRLEESVKDEWYDVFKKAAKDRKLKLTVDKLSKDDFGPTWRIEVEGGRASVYSKTDKYGREVIIQGSTGRMQEVYPIKGVGGWHKAYKYWVRHLKLLALSNKRMR